MIRVVLFMINEGVARNPRSNASALSVSICFAYDALSAISVS